MGNIRTGIPVMNIKKVLEMSRNNERIGGRRLPPQAAIAGTYLKILHGFALQLPQSHERRDRKPADQLQ